MSDNISKQSDKIFKTRVKWKVAQKELKEINGYSYSYFKFKFKIVEQAIQEEFAELIGSDAFVMPWEICNFFLSKNIIFSIHFRYLLKKSPIKNFKALKLVMDLKLQQFNIKREGKDND